MRPYDNLIVQGQQTILLPLRSSRPLVRRFRNCEQPFNRCNEPWCLMMIVFEHRPEFTHDQKGCSRIDRVGFAMLVAEIGCHLKHNRSTSASWCGAASTCYERENVVVCILCYKDNVTICFCHSTDFNRKGLNRTIRRAGCFKSQVFRHCIIEVAKGRDGTKSAKSKKYQYSEM